MFGNGIPHCEVYPRVGGGNVNWEMMDTGAPGLSPRGRGKRCHAHACWDSARSIPAWAGETPKSNCGASRRTVYPRVGGGNIVGR